MKISILLIALALLLMGVAEAKYSPGLEVANGQNLTLQSGYLVGWDGWIPVPTSETWTYASWDGNWGTFTISGDKTATYEVGQKIKLTQTTTKCFLVHLVSYSAGTGLTTVTIFGGTDYDLTNAAIVRPFYSMQSQPKGFPASESKWTVELTDTTTRTQASPTAYAWYNLGGLYLDIPPGPWNVYFIITTTQVRSSGDANVGNTISTTNNAESSPANTCYTGNAGASIYSTTSKQFYWDLTAKTRFYVNVRSNTADAISINEANQYSPLALRAVSACFR